MAFTIEMNGLTDQFVFPFLIKTVIVQRSFKTLTKTRPMFLFDNLYFLTTFTFLKPRFTVAMQYLYLKLIYGIWPFALNERIRIANTHLIDYDPSYASKYNGKPKGAGFIYKSCVYIENRWNLDCWYTFRPIAFRAHLNFATACCPGSHWVVDHGYYGEDASEFITWLPRKLIAGTRQMENLNEHTVSVSS